MAAVQLQCVQPQCVFMCKRNHTCACTQTVFLCHSCSDVMMQLAPNVWVDQSRLLSLLAPPVLLTVLLAAVHVTRRVQGVLHAWSVRRGSVKQQAAHDPLARLLTTYALWLCGNAAWLLLPAAKKGLEQPDWAEANGRQPLSSFMALVSRSRIVYLLIYCYICPANTMLTRL